MNWVLGATVLLLGLLLLEAVLLRRTVNAVPCRVLVTGTRGKSGLVRILSAGIRAVEPATWGKITGDTASLLSPDEGVRELERRGPAHLREQARLLRTCRRRGARCVVVESMAITPEAMAAEARLLRPTLVIVTNVRDDHRETLGADPDRQRAAYLSSIPAGSRWLTRDGELLAFAARSGRYPAPVPGPVPGGTLALSVGNGVADETVATAEAALEALGWNTEAARGVLRAAASRLAPPSRIVTLLGREMTLLDAFSANDPQSLGRLWADWRRERSDASSWSVLLNTRADRPLRTRQFCGWLADRSDVDRVYVAGSHAPAAMRLLRGREREVTRVPRDEPVVVPGTGGSVARTGRETMLVGIGNVSGLGLRVRSDPGGEGRS